MTDMRVFAITLMAPYMLVSDEVIYPAGQGLLHETVYRVEAHSIDYNLKF